MRLRHCLQLALAAYAVSAIADRAPAPDEAQGEEVARYARLEADIRNFEHFTNEEMNDLIFAGLHSGNSKVVALTVAAIGLESRYWDFRGGEYTAEFRQVIGKRKRDLVRVPGIRDFLIDYGRTALAEHGWKAVDDMTVEELEKNSWVQVFSMLPRYFPGDREVRLLLNESYMARPDATNRQHGLMNRLNAGLFVDSEADALRAEQLANPNPSWAGAAARGLAMSGTEAGLYAMADAVRRRQDGVAEIVTAMGMYGAAAGPLLAGLFDAPGVARQAGLDETAARVASQVRRLAMVDVRGLPNLPLTSGGASDHPPMPGDGHGEEALELDLEGVPVVANWQGRKEPLDFALQLYDSFSESAVLDIVFAGLSSKDPVVLERTVFAVGLYAHLIAKRDWPSHAPTRGEWLVKTMDSRTRRLEKVPGLKGFLLAYARGGMSPASCRERAARPDADWPTWMLSVAAMAVYFPGNAEVRDLLLDMGRCLDAAGANESVLPLLAAGRFRGEAVEDWHVAKLTHPDPVRAGWAAQGLCWTLTDTGLAALVDHLPRTAEAPAADGILAEVVEAIACHGVRAAPHLPALRSLAGGRLPESTRARIASATSKLATLASRRRVAAD